MALTTQRPINLGGPAVAAPVSGADRVTAAQMDEIIRRVCADSPDPAFVQILRSRRDSCVARVSVSADSGQTVIVKLWKRPGLRGLLRRWSRTGSVRREYRTLDRLHRAGVSVPSPLGIRRVALGGVPYTDALFVQDIGASVTAMAHVQQLVAQGNLAGLRAFEDELIEMTAALIHAGVVDPDHGLLNVVILPNGRAVRLDFEIARYVVFPRRATRAFGDTLGRMIASFTFAVQPDVACVRDFAGRLVQRIGPPRRVLNRCRWYVNDRMDRQRREKKVDTTVDLPW